MLSGCFLGSCYPTLYRDSGCRARYINAHLIVETAEPFRLQIAVQQHEGSAPSLTFAWRSLELAQERAGSRDSGTPAIASATLPFSMSRTCI